MKLPVEPTHSVSAVPLVIATVATSATKKGQGRKPKKKASQPSEPCHTLDQTNGWVPPPSCTIQIISFTTFQCSSNYLPWCKP